MTLVHPWIRFAGAFFFIFLSFTGIILNSLLVVVLYKGRKAFKRNAFFVITWQLVMCDLVALSTEFVVPIPITLAGYDIYEQNIVHLAPSFLETLAYNGSLFFSFLMTINRITVFIFPKINHFIFKSHLPFTIFLFWIVVGLVVGGFNLAGCYKTFESDGFHYQHNCPIWTDGNRLFWEILLFLSTYLPVAMFAAYILMIIFIKIRLDFDFNNWKLRRKKIALLEDKSITKMNREFQLLAQGFLICGVLEIENLVFNALPHVRLAGDWIYLAYFTGSCVSLVLCCIHPTVLFIFNRDIKAGLEQFVKPKRIVTITASTPSTAINLCCHKYSLK